MAQRTRGLRVEPLGVEAVAVLEAAPHLFPGARDRLLDERGVALAANVARAASTTAASPSVAEVCSHFGAPGR